MLSLYIARLVLPEEYGIIGGESDVQAGVSVVSPPYDGTELTPLRGTRKSKSKQRKLSNSTGLIGSVVTARENR